jgi:hypothetical protein
MSEILGLIDALEALILEGKKILLTDTVLLDEKKMLQLLDKMRFSAQSNGSVVRKAVDISKSNMESEEDDLRDDLQEDDVRNVGLDIEREKEEINKIQQEADDYADCILANLQLMVSKMQKNMVTLEKNIESGRSALDGRKSQREGVEDET